MTIPSMAVARAQTMANSFMLVDSRIVAEILVAKLQAPYG